MTTYEAGAQFLPEAVARIFDDRFAAAHAEMNRYALARLGRLVRELAPDRSGDGTFSRAELFESAGVVPAGERVAGWILDFLTAGGILAREGDRYRFAPAGSFDFEGALAAGPAWPTRTVFDRAVDGTADLLRGKKSGEEILFGLSSFSLWFDYFDRSNLLYAANNRLAALVLADRLLGGERILELGGGAGSAALAFLDELEGRSAPARPAFYHFTELVRAFERRASRALAGRMPAGTELRSTPLDFDKPFGSQGIEPASFDAVWAVNALHVARDLEGTLGEIRSALRPGGLLVAGECVRPAPGAPIYTELGFNFLDSWWSGRTDGRRSSNGFLSGGEWRACLLAAGFREVESVPDIEAVQKSHPEFVAAAIVARS
jgi:SAM-dependent methyltransferase